MHIKMKNWKAECPKCQHVEYSEEMETMCENCDAPAMMTYGRSKNGWQDNASRQSWRQMQCSRGCGWTQNQVTCSKCGSTIQGDFFKGSTKWCFVATAAFNDEDHPTVESLREWRDKRLVNSKVGLTFINYYYSSGESAAIKLNKYPSLKPVVRVLLTILSKLINCKCY